MTKRLFVLLMAAVMIVGLLPAIAFAGSESDDYELLRETDRYAVYTKTTDPWTYDDGIYTSGNAAGNGSLSNMKIVAKTAGILSFDWVVSTTDSFGYFAYRTSGEYTGDTDVTNQTEAKATGSTDGTESGIVLAVGGTVYLTFYSVYSIVADPITNTASVSNIALSDYTEQQEEEHNYPVVYSGNEGTITYELVTATTENNKTTYTYSAVALNDMTVGNTYRVTATANTGKQFYGWFRHYQYNGRTLVAYEASENGAITFTMNETTYYTPEFADEGAYFARNGVNFYSEAETTLSEVLQAASKDTVVVLLKDYTISGDLTVPKRVTLYVPFRDSWGSPESGGNYYYCSKNTSECSLSMAGANKCYCRLTIPAESTVTVNGTLAVGSILSYPSQRYQGHVSGWHGRITNNGTIFVGNGGTFSCLGITEGSGTVYGDDGALVREPLIIGDFSGGSNSADLYFDNQMPFKRFSMQNIQCTLQMEANATLKARAIVYALSTYNDMDITLFGTTNMSAFRSGGAADTVALTRTYDGTKTLTDGNGLLDVTGVGLTHWSFSSSMTFQAFKIDFGITLDTGSCDFVIPYNFDINLISGTYTIPNSIKLLPGAKLTVGENATAVISGRLFAVPGLMQSDMSGDRYPTRAELEAAGYTSYGQVIVNGVLVMQSGSTLGGVIDSSGGGTIRLADTVYLENRTADLTTLSIPAALNAQGENGYDEWAVWPTNTYTGVDNWVQQDGARGYYDENTTWYNNPALLYDGETLITPEAGKTYTSSALVESATVTDSYEGLYVTDGTYGKVKSTDNYGYLTESGVRTMSNGSYTFSRTVSASWAAVVEELEIAATVAGSETNGATSNGVELEIQTRPAESGTLIYAITPKKNDVEVTQTYVFLVQYTVEGSDAPITVAPTEDGWLIPAEASGVTVQSALLGDTTGDGVLDASDAVAIKRRVAKLEAFNDLQNLSAETDGNSIVDASDAVKLLRVIAKLDEMN